MRFEVYIYWKDNSNSVIKVEANCCSDAENYVLEQLTGTQRDNIYSYFAEVEDMESFFEGNEE